MSNVAVDNFASEFMQGQKDCKNGSPHKAGRSEAYNRGYATEYEKEQVIMEMTRYELR